MIPLEFDLTSIAGISFTLILFSSSALVLSHDLFGISL